MNSPSLHDDHFHPSTAPDFLPECSVTSHYGYNMVKEPYMGMGSGVQLEAPLCFGCAQYILDSAFLQLDKGGPCWHVHCLRCVVCQVLLEQFRTCYFKEDQLYCKSCYSNQYGVNCARCGRAIQASDWVRRARMFVYHLACFACDNCKRQLSTGEEFALQDGRILCKQHYTELLDGDTSKSHHKRKTKRVRTTFSEEQLQVLQANFQVDSNPDGQDLERIATITGLSKRVTQVWFQNSRARQKKYQGLKVKQQQQQQGTESEATLAGGSMSGSESVTGSETMEMDLELSPGPVSDPPNVHTSTDDLLC